MEKVCSYCGETKDYQEFRNDKRLKCGKRSRCKMCERKIDKEKFVGERAHKHENARTKRMYGITLEDITSKIKNQNNKCAVCGEDLISKGNNICVDHSHTSGKVRDILCRRCNMMVGYMEGSPQLVKDILMYLDYEH